MTFAGLKQDLYNSFRDSKEDLRVLCDWSSINLRRTEIAQNTMLDLRSAQPGVGVLRNMALLLDLRHC